MGLFNPKDEKIEATASKAERKPLTDDQKRALEARKAARQDAFDKLKDAASKALKDGLFDADTAKIVADALKALTPLRSATASVRETMFDKMSRLFADKKVVTGPEAYAFENTHYGTSDMRRNVILALKTAPADKRMWIEYDGKNDNYTVLSIGATPPLGWIGFVPVDAVPETGSVPAPASE